MEKKFTQNMIQPESVAGEAVAGEIEKGQGHRHKRTPDEEAARREAEMRTQGAKGCKLKRINLSVSSDNYDFVTVMAKMHGQTMTRYINDILDEYRKKNDKIYKEILNVREKYDL